MPETPGLYVIRIETTKEDRAGVIAITCWK
jgi:hypothetical protein